MDLLLLFLFVMNPIYFFIPNLIGYSRIFFLLLSGYLYNHNANENVGKCVLFYSISMGLDAFDGMAARYFKQTSTFGAQLDMLTDRMTTLSLYFALAVAFPQHWWLCALFAMLDIVSHWMHMMSKLDAGHGSHKTAHYPFLKLYYESKPVMVVLCFMQEFFLLGYLWQRYSPTVEQFFMQQSVLFYASLIGYSLKQITNVMQLIEAADYYATNDLAKKENAEKRPKTVKPQKRT